ncbi:MAG TPA: hypothetical protein VGD94_16755 [Vicinamibacterales bacterium]
MSDGNSIGRRQLLTAGVAGVVGAAAGFLGGRQEILGVGRAPGSDEQAALAGEFKWTLTVQGGFGWLFGKDPGTQASTVTLLALRDECRCSSKCPPHHMKLITMPEFVDVSYGQGNEPQTEGPYLFWDLEGAFEFGNMPGNGIIEPRRTNWSAIEAPWGPEDRNDPFLWNDQVWLPERAKARSNATDPAYASASFRFTDGELSVMPPTNAAAREGHWVFAGKTEQRKALTDVLNLAGRSAAPLVLKRGNSEISFKPKGQGLPLWIRHTVRVEQTWLTPGYRAEHYASLFQFVDAGGGEPPDCPDIVVPVFDVYGGQVREGAMSPDVTMFTPGDLCPPLPLDGEP